MAALVDALRYDPFYVTITEEFADDEARRREALARYFDYSMSEGARIGRLVVRRKPKPLVEAWISMVKCLQITLGATRSRLQARPTR